MSTAAATAEVASAEGKILSKKIGHVGHLVFNNPEKRNAFSLDMSVAAAGVMDDFLSDDNIRSFSTSLNNIEEITTELEARRGMLRELEEALAGANRAIAEYEALGAEARQLVQGDGARAIASIERAAAQAEEAMGTLNETTEGLQGPVSDFATNGLPRFANAIQSLEEAADSLDRLVDDVRASPRDFIGRPEAIELEVEQ